MQANGGYLQVLNGRWHFVLDHAVRAKLQRILGGTIPFAVPLEPMWCNRTAPFAPTLGGFYHPQNGHYCHPESVPAEWTRAWMMPDPATTPNWNIHPGVMGVDVSAKPRGLGSGTRYC